MYYLMLAVLNYIYIHTYTRQCYSTPQVQNEILHPTNLAPPANKPTRSITRPPHLSSFFIPEHESRAARSAASGERETNPDRRRSRAGPVGAAPCWPARVAAARRGRGCVQRAGRQGWRHRVGRRSCGGAQADEGCDSVQGRGYGPRVGAAAGALRPAVA